MKKMHAFLLGMWEFRSSFTTYFSVSLINSYDSGRELAHWLTFRRYEQ